MAREYIDMTPTWRQILPTWLMMYRQAILGDCTNPSLVRANAVAEFERMADAADRWNALSKCKELAVEAVVESTNQTLVGELSTADICNMFFDRLIEDAMEFKA